MRDLVLDCTAVRLLIEKHGDRVDWGTLPWAVDRLLECLGGGPGLAPTDSLEMNRDEIVALGLMLGHLIGEEEVAQAEAILYPDDLESAALAGPGGCVGCGVGAEDECSPVCPLGCMP